MKPNPRSETTFLMVPVVTIDLQCLLERSAAVARSVREESTTRADHQAGDDRIVAYPIRHPESALLDLDRLPVAEATGGAVIGFVQASNPEIHDRANTEELLPPGIPEVLARFGRHDPIHQTAATFAEPGGT